MGRLRKYGIRKFFIYSTDGDKSECQCVKFENGNPDTKCGIVIKGNKSSNLKTHVKKRHPHIYKSYLEEEKQEYSAKELKSPPKKINFNNYLNEINSNHTAVSIKPHNVINGIIEMLTLNGRPFSMLTDSGFHRAFNPVLNACGLTLNANSVRFHRSSIVHNIIKDMVKNPTIKGYETTTNDDQTNSINKRLSSDVENGYAAKSSKRLKSTTNSIGSNSNYQNQKTIASQDIDLSSFSRYVASSLRHLSPNLCFKAQDEIQLVLSKYRLENVKQRTYCEVDTEGDGEESYLNGTFSNSDCLHCQGSDEEVWINLE